MNTDRRKQLATLQDQLSDIKAALNSLQDDEQTYLDSIPDNLQEGEKAVRSQEAIDSMEAAMDSIEEAMTSIEEASQ